MTQELTIQRGLALLGLESAVEIAAASLVLDAGHPPSENATGLPDLALMLATAIFEPVSVPEIEAHGFFLASSASAPHHLDVSASGPLVLRSPWSGELWRHADGQGTSLRFDLRERVIVAVEGEQGPTLVLVDQGGVVRVRLLQAAPTVAQGADLDAWTEGLRDLWMLGQIENLDASDHWGTLLVVGRLARLGELYATPAERRAAVDDLLRGRVDPRHRGPRAWASRWSEVQREQVRGWTLARIDSLQGDLKRVERGAELMAPEWRASLLATLRSRDDLEGVVLLLLEGGEPPDVVAALDALDTRGEAFARAASGRVGFYDVQLDRARSIETLRPWWTRFGEVDGA